MKWRCLQHSFDLSLRGEIMGILNVTPDSFSDGGRFASVELATEKALAMIDEGAAIIDIGGESTRPGAAEVSSPEEQNRVLPVIKEILRRLPAACLSIDTSKAEVARAAIEAGASIINDITGFRDPSMIQAAAETDAGIVVMHMQGTPRTMQTNPSYTNVVADIRSFFEKSHETLTSAGISPEAIVYDPGIGFGKTLEHNLELLKNLDQLTVADRPVLLGVSRKSFIGTLTGSDRIEDRNWPTVAITSRAREQGIPLHRVHEVRPNCEALRMTEAILTEP
ncbi:MAG: dihydropteroate synthase [Verrucomicrobiales bacterium]|nr:dihydropteroate synthase [Verrucomicrobiales bacterium]